MSNPTPATSPSPSPSSTPSAKKPDREGALVLLCAVAMFGAMLFGVAKVFGLHL